MARKGENIYKRKDGRWEGRYVKVRLSGKTKFGYVYAKTYHEVKKKLSLAKTIWQEEQNCTQERGEYLGTIGRLWIGESEVFLKESTVAKYNDYLNCYIAPELGDRCMADISDKDVSDFCQKLLKCGGSKNQGLSEKTVLEIYRIIKSLRKYAIKHNYRVGYSDDSIIIRQKQTNMRVFTHQEQQKLCGWLENNPSLYNIGIMICLYTGIRIGELCALKWKDISIAENQIHISHTLQRIRNTAGSGAKTKIVYTLPKSTYSIRDIPIPKILLQYLEPSEEGNIFFLSGTEKCVEPRVMQNQFKDVLIDAGISSANFHALRHTFATNCVEVGFDIKCLSEILGHSSVNITLNRYVHPSMDLKQENMSKLQKNEFLYCKPSDKPSR